MELRSSHLRDIRNLVGYCPQNNTNYAFLTIEEHLDLILNLKHISKNMIKLIIDAKLAELNLTN